MVMELPALDELDTFPKLLLHNAANWPNDVAMREKEFGIWNQFTWAEYRDRVRLVALGLAIGSPFVVLTPTSPGRWHAAHFASGAPSRSV